MNISFDREELQPLVRLVVEETLDRVEAERAKLTGRLAYTEAEAAALLSVKPHVLRDCRRRGEIEASRVGAKIVYRVSDLVEFLERQKENS